MRIQFSWIGFFAIFSFSLSSPANFNPGEPDWSEGAIISRPRANPYVLENSEFFQNRLDGQRMTLEYPVNISGVLMPWRPIQDFVEKAAVNPIRLLLQAFLKNISKVKTTDDLFARIGLNSYPEKPQPYPFDILSHSSSSVKVRMGVTLFNIGNTEVFTLSCAACHSANLFGKKILGMTNRFPLANEFFVLGRKGASLISPTLFRASLNTNSEETDLYSRLRARVRAVGAKKPQALGLDTSLSQVALSLAHRNQDGDATFNRNLEDRPREEILTTFIADSKPAVWWNLKFKDRWLSDGSVVSGNPILTNILWNELGRGTDLVELESWLKKNGDKIKALTTAVFSTEAPRYTDFFPARNISIPAARRGETLFAAHCERCHGSYEKAWSLPESSELSYLDQLKTTRVTYHQKTPVLDVGTDPQRAAGMKSLELGLNPLNISQENHIVIKTQNGYVPPPLVGIWARWPYFHNNSVPSLCAVLSPVKDRPATYYSGEANNAKADFDDECNGYPLAVKTPEEWKTAEHLYDTRKEGLSNRGHDEGIISNTGVSIFSNEERSDLIQYLKTL